MQVEKLDNMVNGWFVGAFSPVAYKTSDVEVAVKKYVKGQNESAHFHKVATETTLILQGLVQMNGQSFGAGDIIILAPGEVCDFTAIEDTVTVVVKHPGALNDKYLSKPGSA